MSPEQSKGEWGDQHPASAVLAQVLLVLPQFPSMEWPGHPPHGFSGIQIMSLLKSHFFFSTRLDYLGVE